MEQAQLNREVCRAGRELVTVGKAMLATSHSSEEVLAIAQHLQELAEELIEISGNNGV
jgi:ABC-type molybdenum transport system ATPase subunit/photorepair protein PhrA